MYEEAKQPNTYLMDKITLDDFNNANQIKTLDGVDRLVSVTTADNNINRQGFESTAALERLGVESFLEHKQLVNDNRIIIRETREAFDALKVELQEVDPNDKSTIKHVVSKHGFSNYIEGFDNVH